MTRREEKKDMTEEEIQKDIKRRNFQGTREEYFRFLHVEDNAEQMLRKIGYCRSVKKTYW